MEIEVVHAIPGRVRLKIPGIKTNPARADDIREWLRTLSGIRQAAVNPNTGSVLILYDQEDQDSVLASVGTAFPDLDVSEWQDRWAPSPDGDPSRPALAEHIVDSSRQLNARVEQGTGGIDLKLALPLTLAGLGALDLLRRSLTGRKPAVPNWYDLLWFAFASFLMLNPSASGDSPAADERP
jgi:hypothetical protein